MKTKTALIVLLAAIVCIFASGYCMAADNAPTNIPSNTSEVAATSAQSVQQATNADAKVDSVVSLKNVIENLSDNAPQNSRVSYLTSIDASNNKTVNIDISKGTELLFDTDVSAKVVNITGDGALMVTDGNINAEQVNITMATVSMGVFTPPDITSGTQIGATIGISSSSEPVQLTGTYITGTIQIPPSNEAPVGTTIVGPDQGEPTVNPPELFQRPVAAPPVYNGPTILNPAPGGLKLPPAGSDLESQVKVSKKANPIYSAPRVGPNLGTTMDTPISTPQQDEKNEQSPPTTYKPHQPLGGATLVGTVEENKTE